jgi:hypothetical protein
MTGTMTQSRSLDTALWQRNLASLIASGLFVRAEVGRSHGLATVVGVYADGTVSAPLAKYSDHGRAEDAVQVVNRLAAAASSVLPAIPVEPQAAS